MTGEGSGGGRDKSKPLTLPQAARLAPERLLSLVLKVFKQQWRQVAHLLAVIANTAEASPSDGLESWLGPAPSDPVALELRSRKKRSRRRRVVLRRTIGADEVAERLQTRSRQTPHDRVRAGTLLAIRETAICVFLSVSSIQRVLKGLWRVWLTSSRPSTFRQWPNLPGWSGPIQRLAIRRRSRF